MKNKSILLVEDDFTARTHISNTLKMLFQTVLCAVDGEEAYTFYEDERPDIVLTDIQMPRQDGIKLISHIRKNDYNIPIVILTGYDEKNFIFNAANLSVDGYLLKPIEFSSLVRTLTKALNRSQLSSNLIMFNEALYFNRDTKEFYRNNAPLTLSHKEVELVELLLANHHKTVSKEMIELHLWNYQIPCESAVKNLVLRIRKKLGDDIVFSIRGIGYRINIDKNQQTYLKGFSTF